MPPFPVTTHPRVRRCRTIKCRDTTAVTTSPIAPSATSGDAMADVAVAATIAASATGSGTANPKAGPSLNRSATWDGAAAETCCFAGGNALPILPLE